MCAMCKAVVLDMFFFQFEFSNVVSSIDSRQVEPFNDISVSLSHLFLFIMKEH